MMAEPQLLTEITQEALRLRYRESGLSITLRFLNQFTTGFDNYTEAYSVLLENQTVNEALVDLCSYQAKRIPRQQDL
jgi:hypothetical protein